MLQRGFRTLKEYYLGLTMHVIAHRGASKEKPENTVEAYLRAIALGVDFVEIDIRLTRDRTLVCHHDAEINGTKKVSDLASKELLSLQPSIPTLEEVLALPFGGVGLLIELKEEDIDPSLYVNLMEKLVAQRSPRLLIFGSFSVPIVRELSSRWPAQQLVGIVEEVDMLPRQLELRPARVALDVQLATPERFQEIQQAGADVWIWTVDCPNQAKQMERLGATGIITNDPVRLTDVSFF